MTIPLNRFDALEDTDLLACTETDGVTYKVTGAQFKEMLGKFIPDPYTEEDCHIFIANGKTVNIPTPNGAATFISVNKVEVTSGPITPAAGDIIHAIFDWNNTNSTKQDWFSDILQFGLNSVTGAQNQLKDGKYAFYYMEANPETLKDLDVSSVQSMLRCLSFTTSFNQDIGGWEVGNVPDTRSMFYGAEAFNQDIGGWDVSNVTDMNSMFRDMSSSFNHPIGAWNVSNVENMNNMFNGLASFNQDLSQWCVTKIDSKPDGFDKGCVGWNNDKEKPCWSHCPRGENGVVDPCPPPWAGAMGIYHVIVSRSSNIKVTKEWYIYNLANQAEVSSINAAGEWIVTGPNTIFKSSTGNWNFGDLTDTSRVTNMCNMFNNAKAFNSDISNWDVGNVTNMGNMFVNALVFNSDISNWNVSNVRHMSYLFTNARVFNSNISNWDVSNATSMRATFREAKAFNQDIGNWDVGNCDYMPWMFENAIAFNIDLSNWDVSKVENMCDMFACARTFNQDISTWDVGNVTNMYDMFRNTQAFNSDISNWDVGNVTNMGQMFFNAHAFNTDISNWNVSNVVYMSNMFHWATSFNTDISKWNVSNVWSMYEMFYNANAFNQDIGNWDVSNVTQMRSMFYNATVFNQDLSSWCVDPEPYHSNFDDKADAWTEPRPVWGTCPAPWDGADAIYHVIVNNGSDINVNGQDKIYNLVNQNVVNSINAPGEWIITGLYTRFQNSLGPWDFGDLTDTSNVTNMNQMFYSARAFNSDLTTWDVGNVTNMYYMFSGARAFNSDISNWDVSNVTYTGGMFDNCTAFNSNISNWDVSNATDMRYMFKLAQAFNQDISTWEVGNATNMAYMFEKATAFNQDIGNWAVGNVTNMHHMFSNAQSFNQNLTGWCVPLPPSHSDFRYRSGMPITGVNDPRWGTCPTRSVTTLNYTVTVANTGYGNKYYLNGTEQQSIDVIVGDTIVFDQSDSTNTGHPLRIYTDEARTTEYTTGVTVDGTTITFVVSESGTFYYQCQAHAGMGGIITVS